MRAKIIRKKMQKTVLKQGVQINNHETLEFFIIGFLIKIDAT